METYWEKLAYSRRELSNCESEPIQFCGAIQNCGWLLVCDPTSGEIVAASENCENLFARSLSEIFGMTIGDVLVRHDGRPIEIADVLNSQQPYPTGLLVKVSQSLLQASFGSTGNYVFLDLEPELIGSGTESVDFIEVLRLQVEAQKEHHDTNAMLSRGAKLFALMTGFDRVMIYQFEPNGDGFVIAESLRDGLESFKGLRYPASDIPPQARKLFEQSKYRMIADVHSEPVPLRTKPGIPSESIDLSMTSLRAVSPFHIQYLTNMGVHASFSVAITVEGKLWGLVACHHYSGPKQLSGNLRSACELSARIIAERILEHAALSKSQISHQMFDLSQNVLASVTEGRTVTDAIKEHRTSFLQGTSSTGVFVRIGGDDLCLGQVPEEAYIQKIFDRLRNQNVAGIWQSEDIANDLSLSPNPLAVGALVAPFGLGFEEVFVWFRKEFIHEATWGGNPNHKNEAADPLTPRSSFAAWRERVTGKSRPWTSSDRNVAESLLVIFIKGIFRKASELSRANIELARVSRAKDEFIGLVSHELRTPLSSLIGWTEVLRDKEINDPQINQAIEVIDRNAKLQVKLIDDLLDISKIISGKLRINLRDDVSIRGLILEVTEDLAPTAATRAIQIKANLAVDVISKVDPERMRQIIWNLLTNAIKFTNDGGWVSVRLINQNKTFQIEVTDNGLGIEKENLQGIFSRFTQVHESHTRAGGLGLGLSIVKALVEMHGGHILAESEGKGRGSKFVVTLPTFKPDQPASEQPKTQTDITSSAPKIFDGVRVLIAEDTPDAGLVLQLSLRSLGAEAVLVPDGNKAIERLKAEHFDILLSDIGMPVCDGYELMRQWRSYEGTTGSVPLRSVALTAYGTQKDKEKCLAAGFQEHLIKPVTRADLVSTIQKLGIKRRTM